MLVDTVVLRLLIRLRSVLTQWAPLSGSLIHKRLLDIITGFVLPHRTSYQTSFYV